ncbi:MAG: rRNA maturation RNase YbeY [Nitrospirae bacterium]|nr:rRNA maturation RNase YbeY [Nitrospirota bacterium]
MQARQFGVDFYDEISRLLIHGILHLLGYEHERNKYQARKMRRMEKELLIAIQNAKCKNQNYGIP